MNSSFNDIQFENLKSMEGYLRIKSRNLSKKFFSKARQLQIFSSRMIKYIIRYAFFGH